MTAEARTGTGAPGAGPPLRQMGTWASWGRHRRRLVVALLGEWLALGAVAAVGIALEDAAVLLLAAPLLALEWWTSSKLREAEYVEGALAGIDDAELTDDERELLAELEETGGDRAANLLIVRRWLEGDDVLRRYEYPTRELLALRSGFEAIEMLGIAIVLLTAPAVAGVVVGFLLMLLGGRTGATVARSVLGERLYRTPVDDAARARWLQREERVVVALAVVGLIVFALRFVA